MRFQKEDYIFISYLLVLFSCFGAYKTYQQLPKEGQCLLYSDGTYKITSVLNKEQKVKFIKYIDLYESYRNEYEVSWYGFLKEKDKAIFSACKEETGYPYAANEIGPKIKVAVIDTGIIDPENYSKVLTLKRDFTKSRMPSSLPNMSFEGFKDHASVVADLLSNYRSYNLNVQKMNYGISLYDYKIYNKIQQNPVSSTVEAFDQAIKDGVKVINYSSAGALYDEKEKKALEKLAKHGIIVVASAGNDGMDLSKYNSYPCSYGLSNVVCVGGLYKVAEEYYIYPKSNMITIEDNKNNINFMFAPSKNGTTSYAAPQVTKMIVALILKYSTLGYKEIINKIPKENFEIQKGKTITMLNENFFLNVPD